VIGLLVRLRNLAKAGQVTARYGQYAFDNEGFVTCGHLEDLKMLVEQGAEPIEVLEDENGMNGHDFYLLDFKAIVSRGDADELLERELNKVINENWKVLMSHNSKVVFYK
jgi:hypothetical protein